MQIRASWFVIVAGSLLLASVTAAHAGEAAQGGTVTLLSQQRVLTASLPHVSPPQELVATADPGAFREEVKVRDTYDACLPGLGGCEEILLAESLARQNSVILAAANNFLAVQGDGSVLGRGQRPEGPGHAVSRLIVTFAVDGVLPFLLWAEGAGNASISLTGPSGAIASQQGWTGSVTDTGLLPTGAYTLSIEVSGDAYAEYGIRFSVGRERLPTVFCGSTLEKRSYVAGDVVKGEMTLGGVNTSAPVPVELKIWLRLPDGGKVPAVNSGADGSLLMLDGAITYPFDVFPVGTETAAGVYELGCRLLDPATGEKLDEHTFVFEVK